MKLRYLRCFHEVFSVLTVGSAIKTSNEPYPQ